MKTNEIKRLVVGFLFIAFIISFSYAEALGSSKTLVYGAATAGADLFPIGMSRADIHRISSICEPLAMLDSDGNLIPVLAESWEIVDDGKKWRFHIRKGVKFHNGEKLTAEDVSFTIDFCKDPKNRCPRRSLVKAITYDIIDNYTIDVYEKGKIANPILPGVWYPLNILPEDTLTKMGLDAISRNPIGTGPFEIEEWKRGEYLALKAFDGYWGGRAKIDKLIIKAVPESATRIAGLKSGDIDLITNIPPTQIRSLEKAPNIEIKKKMSLCAAHLQLRCDIPPFKDNIDLRRAVVHAIDSKTICEEILGGFAVPEGSCTPSSVFGYNKNVKPHKFDPKLAKEYLAKSGYKGEEIKLHATTGKYFMDIELCAAVTGYLKNIGLNIKMGMLDSATWSDKYYGRTIAPIFIVSFCDNSADGLENLFDLASVESQYSWWGDKGIPELEEQIMIAKTSHDKNVRRIAIEKANKILHEQYYFAMVWVKEPVWAMTKGVKWSPRVDEMFLLTNKDDRE